jgi:uncharacterized protein (TIGR00369 family)
VCGTKNPDGLRLAFRPDGRGGVEADFTAEPRFQGFAGMLHGGILAMLLDEAMVNLAWVRGLGAVSAELRVRLKRPVPIGERVRVEGRIVSENRRIVRAAARALLADGTLAAEAEGVCVRQGAAARPQKGESCRT